ncbi:hypothetical protein M0804_008868 [Polistes exclamans]|nr:hypothetical protein M0804_008868 [Polistes exclamans]
MSKLVGTENASSSPANCVSNKRRWSEAWIGGDYYLIAVQYYEIVKGSKESQDLPDKNHSNVKHNTSCTSQS